MQLKTSELTSTTLRDPYCSFAGHKL